MTKRALSRRLAITLALFALYTIGRFGIDQIRPPGLIPNDYMNFHRAAERLTRGVLVYNADDESPYKYSPTFLVAFRATFDRLPHAVAWGLWCALSIIGFAWATHWLWTHVLPKGLNGGLLAALILAFSVFAWHGYLEHFSYGQGDMFLFALFIAAVALPGGSRENPWSDLAPAALLSALVVMKPQSAILLAYFLTGRRWKLLGLTAVGTVALLLAPALGWGWAKQCDLFYRWRIVLSSQSVEFMTGNLNQSLAATIARLSGRRELVFMLTPLMLALGAAFSVGAAVFWPLERGADPPTRVWRALGVLLLYAMICPLSWRWSTFLWLPVGVLLAVEARRPSLGARGGALLSARVALVLFACNGVLLQTWVAHLVGISEVDELSRLGLYTLGNVLLLVAYTSLISRPNRGARSRAP